MEKIEVFELVIDTDDESGVTAIALVDQPAIESIGWHLANSRSISLTLKTRRNE